MKTIFQSAHPYVGCDLQPVQMNLMICDFNPRTPMWGATPCIVLDYYVYWYFNPRTPMWGATGSHVYDEIAVFISIRAPLCGVRQHIPQIPRLQFLFQSAHPYVGCDIELRRIHEKGQSISIRAPLCGVRPQAFLRRRSQRRDFNPRTPMWGATIRPSHVTASRWDFNPRTPMWGATENNEKTGISNSNFNPRTPMWGAT